MRDVFTGTFTPVYCDGFDNYALSAQRWTAGSSGFVINTVASRHAWGQGAFTTTNGQIELLANSEFIIEGAMRVVENPASFGDNRVVGFGKIGVPLDAFHCSIRLNSQRHPYFTRDDTGALIAGPTIGPEKAMEMNVWYWVQVYVKIDGSVGEMQMYVNNNHWLSADGLDTKNDGAIGGSSQCDLLQWGGAQGWGFWGDDFVIQDGSVGKFMGDMIVIGKRPVSAGAYSDFTAVGAATGHEATDEVSADEDTTHIASETIGEKHSSIIADITEVPESSLVLAVQQAFRHRKDEPGPRSVTPFLKVGADEVFGEERFPSENAYLTMYDPPYTKQPDGVTDWPNVGDFNDLDVEVGVETGDGFGESS